MNDTQQDHKDYRRGVAETLVAAGWTGDTGRPLTPLLRHPSGAVFGVLGPSGHCVLGTPGGGGPAEFPGSIPDHVVIAACLAASGQTPITSQGHASSVNTASPNLPQAPRRHAPHTTAPAPSTPGARPASAPCGSGPQEPHGTAHAARHPARTYTDTVAAGDEEYVPMVCSQCGRGGYQPMPGRSEHGTPVYECTTDGCGYTVDESAFDLYSGERLTVHNGRLHFTRRLSDTPA